MKVNVAKYNENATRAVPFSTKEYKAKCRFFRARHDWSGKHDRDAAVTQASTRMLKAVFGAQQTTRNYSCRNWIWTFQAPSGLVLYALSSVKGVAFEYDGTKRTTATELAKAIDWVTQQVEEWEETP